MDGGTAEAPRLDALPPPEKRPEVGVEIPPHIVLDPLPGAQHREARAEPRQGMEPGQENDHARVIGDGAAAAAEAVHRLLDLPRDAQRKARGESAKQPTPAP